MTSTIRSGLVLTGGGARVAYQVGAIKALAEILPTQSIPFQTICGTSAGGINAAYLSSKAESWVEGATSLYNLWKNIELKDIYETTSKSLSAIGFAWIVRTLIGGKSGTREIANYLLDTSPLGKLLSREIDFDAIRTNIANKTLHALALSALEYFNDRTVSFFEAADDVSGWERAGRTGQRTTIQMEHVLASAAIPVFFPPVAINNRYYGDGSVRQMTPLSPAIHLGADRLLCIGIRHERKAGDAAAPITKAPSLAQISGELFNSLFLDPLHADTERLKRINDSIARYRSTMGDAGDPSLKEIPILNLMPSKNLTDVLPSLVNGFPPSLRYLLKGFGASDRDGQGQSMISYLAFFNECVQPLLDLGYADTLVRQDEITAFMKNG